ncbi:WD40 repeat-like protein [Martensiomyces pterosporus]|nr:WD40 repeat-like protein [Martensiomyces pterosporus]
MVEVFGYFSVQPDWQVDVKSALAGNEGAHKFWVSAYKQGQPSIHDTVTVTRSASADGTSLISLDTGGAGDITAEYINPYQLRLSSQKLGIPPTVYTASRKSVRCSQITRGSGVQSFDISRYGGLAVACGDDGAMDVYETEGSVHRVQLEGHFGDVTCCQFFPSGQVALSGATDMRLKIWSASDGTNPVTLVGHHAAITDTSIVGVGKNVVSASKDGTVRLWHCGSSSLLHTFSVSKLPINRIELVTCSPTSDAGANAELPPNEFETSGVVVATGCEDGRVVLLDLLSKSTVAVFGSLQHAPVRAVAYDVSQGLIFTGLSDGVVELWSVDDPSTPLYALKRNDSPVTNINLVRRESGSPLVCVATEDGQLFLASFTLAAGRVTLAEIVEDLVGFDVDPISRVRVSPSIEKKYGRQAIWASGRGSSVFEF